MPGLSGLELLGRRARTAGVSARGARHRCRDLRDAQPGADARRCRARDEAVCARGAADRGRRRTRASLALPRRAARAPARADARERARERDRSPRLLPARALRATRHRSPFASPSCSAAAHEIETIRLGAILHDVGKIGIPDRVLLKPGALDDEERRIIETHPEIGDKLLEPLDLLAAARPIVRNHHERWDGAGYPDQLAGTAIPLGARIVAVADSVEVMTARQLYRQPLTPTEVAAELVACRAQQWDPQIVDLVLRLIESGELELDDGGLHVREPSVAEPLTPTLAVLLVEDDDDMALLVTATLERALEGAVIARARNLASAAELVLGSEWSLAIVDHGLQDGCGMDVLDALRASNPLLPVVMLTGQGSEETAVEAFRHGASDYVIKGDAYLEALAARVRTLVAA